MAQGIQRDPLGVASGGLTGLYGVTFSPLPPTEGDVVARRGAIVPQFSGPSAYIMSTPMFKPTLQAILPTPLLRRPEEIGRAAFRPIREEAQFPVLKPAETIEEIDQRLSSILSDLAPPVQAPSLVQPTSAEGAGSIFEAPGTAPSLPVDTATTAASMGAPQLQPSRLATAPPTTTQPPPDQYLSLALSPSPPPPPQPQPPNAPLFTILRAL